jgi:hypothetical protein
VVSVLLAVLCFNLIVLVVFVGVVLGRRWWASGQPGSFAGIAQVLVGDVNLLGHRSRPGYGRWVRDVLVWTPGPLCLRNALTPIDRVDGDPAAATDPVQWLGENPQTVTVVGDRTWIRVTVRAQDVPLVIAPFT